MMQGAAQAQRDMFNRRLPVIMGVMLILSILLLLQLISFQGLSPDVANELSQDYNRTVKLAAARGIVYDRDGQRLAVNTLQYKIGISPNLVANPQRTATQLASILNLDELKVYQSLTSQQRWVLLAPNVNADVGQRVEQLKDQSNLYYSLTIEKLPRRAYPQGPLAAQILGFVGGDLKGYYGIEEYYNQQLSGKPREEKISDIPFDLPPEQESDRGSDIYLTIDRDLQYLAESQLQSAVTTTQATGGTIIIMNPRTGDILAMANYPSYDPNDYIQSKQDVWKNAAISNEYEPGSVMKVVTIASALDSGTITPDWTYNDQGNIEIGGVTTQNWDRGAHGMMTPQDILVQSLNVGAATVSLKMGTNNFYKYMTKFGFGRLTGINLAGEVSGTMHVPGDTDWSESNLGTNAYGQGIAVTPLQMLTAVSSIANDGLMMQPNIVRKIVTGDQTVVSQPVSAQRTVSAETAHLVRDMMVAVVRDGLDDKASLPGYTIAGKTGTAEIASPVGYRGDAWIMSFIGFLPADDPQVSVLIKLDEPKTGRFASQVVAPIFRQMAERMVIILKIPPDDQRQALQQKGGQVNGVSQ
jgi:cell division protein FtsI/penicillin-binding protein 2